jgi:hypothetical protein
MGSSHTSPSKLYSLQAPVYAAFSDWRREQLSKVTSLALCCDVWHGLDGLSYLGGMAHFVDDDYIKRYKKNQKKKLDFFLKKTEVAFFFCNGESRPTADNLTALVQHEIQVGGVFQPKVCARAALHAPNLSSALCKGFIDHGGDRWCFQLYDNATRRQFAWCLLVSCPSTCCQRCARSARRGDDTADRDSPTSNLCASQQERACDAAPQATPRRHR